jgi:hypothetical protein
VLHYFFEHYFDSSGLVAQDENYFVVQAGPAAVLVVAVAAAFGCSVEQNYYCLVP